jgi:hypothetical protein
MRRLGSIVACVILVCLSGGRAVGEESTVQAITSFGLIGSWSVDCSKEPTATCSLEKGCGARTTYEVSPSGSPVMKYTVGEIAGQPRTSEFSIEQATPIADDRIRMVLIQRTGRGSVFPWRWEVVMLKEGNKFRTYSANREDRKRIAAEDGFAVTASPGTKSDEPSTQWVRSDKPTPWLEKCGD